MVRSMATDGSALAASLIEVGLIYPTMQELRAAATKQVVASVAWCGMWRVEGAFPYVDIRIERAQGKTMEDR